MFTNPPVTIRLQVVLIKGLPLFIIGDTGDKAPIIKDIKLLQLVILEKLDEADKAFYSKLDMGIELSLPADHD